MSQLDMFARSRPVAPVSDLPDPAEVRARMQAKLQELLDADKMPWSDRDLGVWTTLWPQMSRWLPDEERTALIARFDEQIARLAANPPSRSVASVALDLGVRCDKLSK